jgi:SPP1 family predicted phage head-tail adaptor
MPAAGRLDRRGNILEPTVSTNAIGEQVTTWSVWRPAWFGRVSIRGEERLRADQELATSATIWQTQYIPDLTEQHRLEIEGVIYDIEFINEIGRRSGHEITATAVRT